MFASFAKLRLTGDEQDVRTILEFIREQLGDAIRVAHDPDVKKRRGDGQVSAYMDIYLEPRSTRNPAEILAEMQQVLDGIVDDSTPEEQRDALYERRVALWDEAARSAPNQLYSTACSQHAADLLKDLEDYRKQRTELAEEAARRRALYDLLDERPVGQTQPATRE